MGCHSYIKNHCDPFKYSNLTIAMLIMYYIKQILVAVYYAKVFPSFHQSFRFESIYFFIHWNIILEMKWMKMCRYICLVVTGQRISSFIVINRLFPQKRTHSANDWGDLYERSAVSLRVVDESIAPLGYVVFLSGVRQGCLFLGRYCGFMFWILFVSYHAFSLLFVSFQARQTSLG